MKDVVYLYDANIGNYHYDDGHPMKPHRVRMTNSLIKAYDLYQYMDIIKPKPANFEDITAFHCDKYINYVRTIVPDKIKRLDDDLRNFKLHDDCPVFHGLYDFCRSVSGASIECANKINSGAKIAINWSGGLHHAKRAEASGFCYVNDIVLAILELLKYHARVLYVDIDVHHGDGVEEAFYITDRVMTVSFHKYGKFFPGTGAIEDIGYLKGKNYAVNLPLKYGLDDSGFTKLFRLVMENVMSMYDPSVIVLQCGADSLAGDRLGCFNLSEVGHSFAVKYLHSFGKPMVVLGGGGYTINNVAKVWTYETAVLLNKTLNVDIPFNDFFHNYGPEYRLTIPVCNMLNQNTDKFLDECYTKVHENLKNVTHVPSIDFEFFQDDASDEDDDKELADLEAHNANERLKFSGGYFEN